jgi:hypothetical protein
MTGISNAYKFPSLNLASRSALLGENVPYGALLTKVKDTIPVLSRFEMRCIMIQLSYMESQNNNLLVSGNYYGRYQVSEFILKKYGYKNDVDWTGIDGVDTQELFLSSIGLQDKIMVRFLEESYVSLIRGGAIQDNDSTEIVAGMLAVNYQFQDAEDPQLIKLDPIANNQLALLKDTVNNNYSAAKVKIWREAGDQVDTKGRNGSLYFNAGRYAVKTLAADY